MSKLFFDHLVELKRIDKEIRKVAATAEEREELWALVDEIIHHRVMGCILDRLPRDSHEEFLEMYHKSPHDETYIMTYLQEKVGTDIEQFLKNEIDNLGDEILGEISPGKANKTKKTKKSPAKKK